MNLVVLGSGTSVPHPLRASSSHWLETTRGTILLDVSAAAVHRMAQENLDWVNLDAVWVSHFHLDHVGGLAPFLFGTKHAPQTRDRRKPFTVFGPRGTERLLRRFDEAGGYGLFEQPFPFEVREVALRLTDRGGTSLVYTSDTGFTEALAGFARAVDLFLMECSFFRSKPVKLHLELSEAMELARLSGAKRVVLSHLYPEWDGVDIAAEAKRLWDGETIEARDGLRLDIGE